MVHNVLNSAIRSMGMTMKVWQIQDLIFFKVVVIDRP